METNRRRKLEIRYNYYSKPSSHPNAPLNPNLGVLTNPIRHEVIGNASGDQGMKLVVVIDVVKTGNARPLPETNETVKTIFTD